MLSKYTQTQKDTHGKTYSHTHSTSQSIISLSSSHPVSLFFKLSFLKWWPTFTVSFFLILYLFFVIIVDITRDHQYLILLSLSTWEASFSGSVAVWDHVISLATGSKTLRVYSCVSMLSSSATTTEARTYYIYGPTLG